MATARKGVRLFTPNDVQTWYQPEGLRIFIGDVLDEKNSDTMSVGFARYAPGQANEWVVITGEDGAKTTAKVGEFIFLTKGTKLVYCAERRRRSSTSSILFGWRLSESPSMLVHQAQLDSYLCRTFW